MQKLFVLIRDGGDGSSYPNFTFDASFVAFLKAEYDRTGEADMGCDGDGFHFKALTVPEECTPKSMGFQDVSLDEEYINEAGVWRKLSFDEQYPD